MLHLVGIPNCNKIRDTKKWLEEKDIPYTFVDVKKEPLTLDEIHDLEFKVGLDVLLNTRGSTYRRLGLKDKDLKKEELLALMEENQSMIKRPVLIFENSVLVGYDESAFETFAMDNGLLADNEAKE
jgi:Spx/MgsR family transcriptional regulator